MNKKVLWIIVLLLIILIGILVWVFMFRESEDDGSTTTATTTTTTSGDDNDVMTDDSEYDSNSWETLIAESCERFFDGCNTCTRESGSGAVTCTEMACEKYEMPQCLDEEAMEDPDDPDATEVKDNDAMDDDKDTSATGAQTKIVPLTKFTAASNDWYNQVWFNANEDGSDEITYGTEGVTFTTTSDQNSRAGIMTDLDVDVSDYSELNLHMVASVQDQELSGTGWNGREAPVSVAVGYTDADGTVHRGLGEDPTAPTQAFWRGLYTLDPTGSSGDTNGIKVSLDERYTFDFDLMTLDPKPVTIHFVALEGSGWPSRQGTVHELSLTGIN